MSTDQRELLHTQTNAGETHNLSSSLNEELIEREQTEGSPFWIIKENNQYLIVFGKYRLNKDPINNRKGVDQYLKKNLWNIVTTIALIIANDKLDEKSILNNHLNKNK